MNTENNNKPVSKSFPDETHFFGNASLMLELLQLPMLDAGIIISEQEANHLSDSKKKRF